MGLSVRCVELRPKIVNYNEQNIQFRSLTGNRTKATENIQEQAMTHRTSVCRSGYSSAMVVAANEWTRVEILTTNNHCSRLLVEARLVETVLPAPLHAFPFTAVYCPE